MIKDMGPPIEVSDEAFPYLRAQKGSLDHLSYDRNRWLDAYREDLERSFVEMEPYLPPVCWAMLDIGSGLGGIDVLLSRHYAQQEIDVTTVSDTQPRRVKRGDPRVYLLDGKDDAPEMKLHRQTFSNERVARAFLRANGVRSDRIHYYGPDDETIAAPYDLVLSLGSWCFHYEPNVYLPRLLAGGGLHMDSRVIVDLRTGKPEWREQLKAANLQMIAVLRPFERKYQRVVLERQR